MNKKNLKDVLNVLQVLYVTRDSNVCKKTIDILNIFFNKIIKANCLEKALEIYSKSRPAVLIVDIDLPNENGIELIKNIRRTNLKTPIIILSSLKSEEYLFEAIRLNLIDYLLYPLDITKLITALNNVAKTLLYDGQDSIVFKNNNKYNYDKKTVLNYQNITHSLTKNEYRLLEYLIENSHKKLSKEEIQTYLWGEEFITDSAFKSLVCRLKNKIGKESIVNTFGVGYNIEILK